MFFELDFIGTRSRWFSRLFLTPGHNLNFFKNSQVSLWQASLIEDADFFKTKFFFKVFFLLRVAKLY